MTVINKSKKEPITLFHGTGSKQPHEIKIWKNNVSKSKLEIRNKIVLELQPLIIMSTYLQF